ncbi:MAG: DUF2271 domain-containing protein [Rhodanobacteraceae bacterium]|nr:DUF2271 domain-containing protein [Rhodanobacteraceae bacterium]
MRFRQIVSCAAAALLIGSANAADLNLGIEVPRLDVAEYHRPYLAAWVERPDNSVAVNLAVWYQQKSGKDAATGKQEQGTKWLADLRQWWRRSGRSATLPIDGVSGATRPAGAHKLSFSDKQAPLAELKPGKYALVVEAAREVGGRELVRIPFDWPPQKPVHADTRGSTELGAVTLDLAP